MKIQNEGWDSGESFRVGQEIHTVIGYYTGENFTHEMFTKFPIEDGLTIYVRWNDSFEMYWTFVDSSTMTETDLVCDLFHKGDRK